MKTGKSAPTLVKGKLAITRDPRLYAESLPRRDVKYRRVLGLDLASSCGVTFCDLIQGQPVNGSVLVGGQWDLGLTSHDTQSLRLIRLKQFLTVTRPDLIFYEEVKYTAPKPVGRMGLGALVARAVSGAQVVHSLAAILVTWAEERNIPCEAVPIGTLKKFATGKGSANKVDMIRACNEQFHTEFEPSDYESTGVDNIADSMFLCAMAVQSYGESLQ